MNSESDIIKTITCFNERVSQTRMGIKYTVTQPTVRDEAHALG
jgi:hypothetical protein